VKVHEFSPFFNEVRVLEIKLREAAGWIDRVHLCEADHTFSNAPKPWNYPAADLERRAPELGAFVDYAPLATAGLFRDPPARQIYYDPRRHRREGFDSWYWELLRGNAAYHNEAVQRNWPTRQVVQEVGDDDIVILSDVDEILDSRHAERIIDATRKHGIITVKLYFSVFYLNLFSASNHGVPDFAYRLYVMTVRHFRTLPFTPDYLRKRGIEGGWLDVIPCLPEPMGFHHSWLEHRKNAFPKLKAFEANVGDRSIIDPAYAERCLADRRLHYLDADLFVDDTKPFLRALKAMETADLWLGSESN
jgi:hypothetical protein